MKKLSAALLLSTAFLATGAKAEWEGNWLLGVSAGGVWHSNNNDVTATLVNFLDFDETFSFHANNDDEKDHFIWGFLGGYQARCCNWLAGLELNVDWRRDNHDVNFTIPGGTANTVLTEDVSGSINRDRDAVWGLTGRFGYFINACLMPYIRLGFDWSQQDFDFVGQTPDGTIITLSSDRDSGRWGFVGGIGLEWFMPMMSCLSLRAEWDYHSRHHHNNDIVAVIEDSDDNTAFLTVNGGSHRHENTGIISLVYNFSM